MSDRYNGIAEPDDVQPRPVERDHDDLPPRRFVSVMDVEPMTDEQVREEMSRIMGVRLTIKQAI
jgi:hypothetical protein